MPEKDFKLECWIVKIVNGKPEWMTRCLESAACKKLIKLSENTSANKSWVEVPKVLKENREPAKKVKKATSFF